MTSWREIRWRVTKFQAQAASGSCASQRLGRGRRGGARVIYYYLDETMPVYALLAYAKSAKPNLTPDERRTVSKIATALKAARKRR